MAMVEAAQGVRVGDDEKIIIATEEFHGIKLYALGSIGLNDLIKMFGGLGTTISIVYKELGRKMGIIVRPEDNSGNIPPNFAYDYTDEIFFSDGVKNFKPGKNRSVVEFSGCTFIAEYNVSNNSLNIFTDWTRKQANDYLDRTHARETANISVI